MTFSQRIKNLLRLSRKTVAVTAVFPSADAPTKALERVEFPAIVRRMVRVEISTDNKHPNQRRRALHYENDFYNTFQI